MLKPIPEELKKQGVRWVLDINKDKRLVAIELPTMGIIVVSKGYEEDYLMGRNTYFESISTFKEIIPQPQESKKIPYTAETFPDNAIRIRVVGDDGFNNIVSSNNETLFIFNPASGGTIKYKWGSRLLLNRNIDDYEIGCQVIKDGEIKIEWQKFYQIKE